MLRKGAWASLWRLGLGGPVVVLIAGLWAVTRYDPPAPLPVDAPGDLFSAERAFVDLEKIAAAPHPVGSAAHAEVRGYIAAQLTAIGLVPEVQQTSVAIRIAGWVRGAEVHNLWALLPGSAGADARTIVLAAHYDSVPNSPGAGDNGAGVAAILEIARRIKAGPALRNDLVFFFPDAEEIGLLGAAAAVRELEWLRSADLVLNFEGRGNAGPVAMFETSANNAALIAGLGEAVDRPLASSLVAALTKLLPNDTDLTIYKRAGLAGMNFALADNLHHYHSASDTAARLDRGSLQHHGDYGLALARFFGNAEAWEADRDVVYFDVLALGMAAYGTTWAWVWWLLGTGLLVWALVNGRRRGELSLRGCAEGLGLALLAVVACTVAAQGVALAVMRVLAPPLLWAANRGFFFAYLLTAFGVAGLLYLWRQDAVRAGERLLGALVWWWLAALVTTLWAPGASYIFVWPLVFGGVELNLRLRLRPGDRPWHGVATLLLPLPQTLLVAATIYALLLMDGGQIPAIAVLLAALWWGLLTPTWAAVPRRARWVVPLVALGLAAVVSVLTVAGAGYDRDNPARSVIHYAVDSDQQKSLWLSTPGAEDMWLAQFFRQGYEVAPLPQFSVHDEEVVYSAAPPLPLAPPVIETLGTERVGEGARRLGLRISSPRGATCVSLWEETDGGPSRITETALDGRPVESLYRFSAETDAALVEAIFGATRAAWKLNYCGLDGEGVALELTTTAEPLRLRLVDESFGLPDLPGFPIKPRPPASVPAMRSEMIFVSRGIEL